MTPRTLSKRKAIKATRATQIDGTDNLAVLPEHAQNGRHSADAASEKSRSIDDSKRSDTVQTASDGTSAGSLNVKPAKVVIQATPYRRYGTDGFQANQVAATQLCHEIAIVLGPLEQVPYLGPVASLLIHMLTRHQTHLDNIGTAHTNYRWIEQLTGLLQERYTATASGQFKADLIQLESEFSAAAQSLLDCGLTVEDETRIDEAGLGRHVRHNLVGLFFAFGRKVVIRNALLKIKRAVDAFNVSCGAHSRLMNINMMEMHENMAAAQANTAATQQTMAATQEKMAAQQDEIAKKLDNIILSRDIYEQLQELQERRPKVTKAATEGSIDKGMSTEDIERAQEQVREQLEAFQLPQDESERLEQLSRKDVHVILREQDAALTAIKTSLDDLSSSLLQLHDELRRRMATFQSSQDEYLLLLKHSADDQLHRDDREAAELRRRKELELAALKDRLRFAVPPRSANTVGRLDLIRCYAEACCSAKPTSICIRGMGGQGKTTLAKAIVNEPDVMAHFGRRRIFWFECEAMESIVHLRLNIAVALEWPNPEEWRSALNFRLALNLETDTQRRILVVLDNYETLRDAPGGAEKDEAEDLLVALQDVPSLALLITCRGERQPSGVNWFEDRPLQGLSTQEGCRLFRGLWTVKSKSEALALHEQQSLEDLISQVDGHPLCISLLAAFASKSRSARLQNPITNLQKDFEEKRLDMLEVKDYQGDIKLIKGKSMKACLALSFDSHELSSQSRSLLLLLAFLPQPIHEALADELNGLMAASAEQESESPFAELQNASLVSEKTEFSHSDPNAVTYVLHPLVREYARSRGEPDTELCWIIWEIYCRRLDNPPNLPWGGKYGEPAPWKFTHLPLTLFDGLENAFKVSDHLLRTLLLNHSHERTTVRRVGALLLNHSHERTAVRRLQIRLLDQACSMLRQRNAREVAQEARSKAVPLAAIWMPLAIAQFLAPRLRLSYGLGESWKRVDEYIETLYHLAAELDFLGRDEEALEAAEEAHKIVTSDYVDDVPLTQMHFSWQHVIASFRGSSFCLANAGRLPDARARAEQLAELGEQCKSHVPINITTWSAAERGIVLCRSTLASILLDMHLASFAQTEITRVLDYIALKTPDKLQKGLQRWQEDYADANNILSHALSDEGRHDQALLASAASWRMYSSRTGPMTACVHVLQTHTVNLANMKLYQEAIHIAEQNAQVWRDQLGRFTSNTQDAGTRRYAHRLSSSLCRLAFCYEANGNMVRGAELRAEAEQIAKEASIGNAVCPSQFVEGMMMKNDGSDRRSLECEGWYRRMTRLMAESMSHQQRQKGEVVDFVGLSIQEPFSGFDVDELDTGISRFRRDYNPQ